MRAHHKCARDLTHLCLQPLRISEEKPCLGYPKHKTTYDPQFSYIYKAHYGSDKKKKLLQNLSLYLAMSFFTSPEVIQLAGETSDNSKILLLAPATNGN